jgi:hypothetical protein
MLIVPTLQLLSFLFLLTSVTYQHKVPGCFHGSTAKFQTRIRKNKFKFRIRKRPCTFQTVDMHVCLFSPLPPHPLVCIGQTSHGLYKPRLVANYSTCPPLSSPHSFVIGPAVINNNMHVCYKMHVCRFYMFIISACCVFLLVCQHTAPFPD